MSISPLWLAYRTVADGLSANAGYRMAREAGVPVRRQSFLRMVGQIRNHYATRLNELDKPLAARPGQGEVFPLPTKTKTGYIHYVDVFVKDKDTGQFKVREQAVHSSTLLSRDTAVKLAVDRYNVAVDRSKVAPAQWGTDPRERAEGGIYVTTHVFTPTVE